MMPPPRLVVIGLSVANKNATPVSLANPARQLRQRQRAHSTARNETRRMTGLGDLSMPDFSENSIGSQRR
jgi:hypothetical protein